MQGYVSNIVQSWRVETFQVVSRPVVEHQVEFFLTVDVKGGSVNAYVSRSSTRHPRVKSAFSPAMTMAV